jgi:hypothetical protein
MLCAGAKLVNVSTYMAEMLSGALCQAASS